MQSTLTQIGTTASELESAIHYNDISTSNAGSFSKVSNDKASRGNDAE